MRAVALAILALALTTPAFAAQDAAGVEAQAPAATKVVQRTLLKANPGQREALAQFIVANWFAMDKVAVSQGLFTGYRLLENPVADDSWDLVVEVGYPTAEGYDDPATRAGFDAIRAAHTTVLIDGKSLRELGRIVGSERLSYRAGSK